MAAGTFNVLAKSQVIGKVKFVGATDPARVGPPVNMELNKVMFRPSAAIAFISDEWGQMEITGTVLVDDDGIFGTITHPDTGLTSPATAAYSIGKGVVSIQLEGEAEYRDIGNVPNFAFEPDITPLAHYSSRYGVRAKDLEVIQEMSANLTITLEEWTHANLMLAFMGETAGP